MTKELFLPPKPRYDILDGLRGVAALVILLYHVLEGCGVILGHGYLGVDFFTCYRVSSSGMPMTTAGAA